MTCIALRPLVKQSMLSQKQSDGVPQDLVAYQRRTDGPPTNLDAYSLLLLKKGYLRILPTIYLRNEIGGGARKKISLSQQKPLL